MTLEQIQKALLELGYEIVDKDTHLSNKNGKMHIYLTANGLGTGKDSVTVKKFANLRLYGMNMPDEKNVYASTDIQSIYRDGKRIVFNVFGAGKYDYKENTVKEAIVRYTLEINTDRNVRAVTLTDFAHSGEVSYAEYHMASKDWNGNKTSVSNIMLALMTDRINIDAIGDGMFEIYSDGKYRGVD